MSEQAERPYVEDDCPQCGHPLRLSVYATPAMVQAAADDHLVWVREVRRAGGAVKGHEA